jgi:hypothetical protein
MTPPLTRLILGAASYGTRNTHGAAGKEDLPDARR